MTDQYPPPIDGTVPGSWAQTTVTERLPEITRRVITENQFPDSVEERLIRLVSEIQEGSIRSLEDQGAPDQVDWEGYIEPYLGKSWLEVPWLFAEHYFYRRIMEAVDYFQLGLDPYAYQKNQGLERSSRDVGALAVFLAEGRKDPLQRIETFREGLYFSLWGNQADLSLWPAGSADDPRHHSRDTLQEHLLADDSQLMISSVFWDDQPASRMDILLDNAGFELVADLGLADIALGLGLAETLVLHVKAHPTYVSDVILPDLEATVAFLSSSPDPATREFGERLTAYREEGRLLVRESFFWNSPLAMWELPDELRGEWQHSSLLISKGDANYRRVLGDRQWDFTLPFSEIVDFLPAPLAALRTLKAELAVGLTLDRIQEIYNQDRNWMVDGKWGVIHFAPGPERGSAGRAPADSSSF